MGTGGVSRSDLYGREVHEGLVAQSRRTERLFSHHDGTAYERTLQICTGGVEAEAAGFYFAADLRFDQFEQFFVGIEFVCPDIDGEFAAVRNDIVLCPGMDNRDAHLYRSEEIAFSRELIGVEPFDVFHRKRDRIDPLVPGGMSCLAGADTVQDHQPFFGYGRLHAGRFADNGECDRRKVGKSAFQPVLAGNFFFA